MAKKGKMKKIIWLIERKNTKERKKERKKEVIVIRDKEEEL